MQDLERALREAEEDRLNWWSKHKAAQGDADRKDGDIARLCAERDAALAKAGQAGNKAGQLSPGQADALKKAQKGWQDERARLILARDQQAADAKRRVDAAGDRYAELATAFSRSLGEELVGKLVDLDRDNRAMDETHADDASRGAGGLAEDAERRRQFR